MARRRHTLEHVINKLRDHEVAMAQLLKPPAR